MPSECTFDLEKPEAVYFAGEDEIRGVVNLKTRNPKNIKEIKIRFKGVSVVGFRMFSTVYRQHTDLGANYFYNDKNRIIKTDATVCGSGLLEAGTYSWTFSFPVEEHCITSMEGPGGHIRYQVSLKIDNGRLKYNNIFLKPVTILQRIDLNRRSESLQPVETVVSRRYCCGIVRGGPDMILSKFFLGYAPGQKFEYLLNVSSKRPDKNYVLDIIFVRVSTFNSAFPEHGRIVRRTILYSSNKEISKGDEAFSVGDTFVIPATPPTLTLKVMSVEYFFEVTLNVNCCPHRLTASIPIEIGTVPLRESLTPINQMYLVQVRPGQHIMAPRTFEKPGNYDSPFENENITPFNRVDDFMPSYPMFTFD